MARRAARLTRMAWIDAARAALIARGVAGVRVEPLAAALGVTTGSFYWHFRNRGALLRAALEDWESRNSRAFLDALRSPSVPPRAALRALANVWIEERLYSPAWDAAVRDWARTDRRAELAVRRVDARRIAMLKRVFAALGHDAREAFIRARITYFHQVGYYALRIVESRARRRALLPMYLRVLGG